MKGTLLGALLSPVDKIWKFEDFFMFLSFFVNFFRIFKFIHIPKKLYEFELFHFLVNLDARRKLYLQFKIGRKSFDIEKIEQSGEKCSGEDMMNGSFSRWTYAWENEKGAVAILVTYICSSSYMHILIHTKVCFYSFPAHVRHADRFTAQENANSRQKPRQ